jgi:seryl-tRNA synthetase
MIDIKYIIENADLVKQNCQNRGVKVDVDLILNLFSEKKEIGVLLDEKRAMRNQGSKNKPSEEEILKMRNLGAEIKELEEKLAKLEESYREEMYKVPNLTHKDTPIGNEDSYKVLHQVDFKAKDFKYSDHEEILLKKDLLDFERGSKVTGAKFFFTKGDLTRLNLALINYGIDVVTNHGFTLMETPDLAKQSVLEGIGFNPRGNETQIYNIENTDLSLVGTAEITVGGYHKDEVLDLSSGAKKYVALSHCFRTEAGAYGRTSKGMYRVHQFTKLEMFVFCKKEESDKYHDELLTIEKEIADGLGLSYRVIDIPSGDLGGPAYRKFDFEAFMIMKGDENKIGDYGEITSTSNCLDFQSRRLNIRYKNEEGKMEFAHTLNGTAIVTSRLPIAIVEQFQNEDGSVVVPEVLVKYMGKNKF